MTVKIPQHPSEVKTIVTSITFVQNPNPNPFSPPTYQQVYTYDGLTSPNQLFSWNYHLWAAAFGAVVKAFPENKTISVAYDCNKTADFRTSLIPAAIDVPNGYTGTSGNFRIQGYYGNGYYANIIIGGQLIQATGFDSTASFSLPNLVDKIPIAIRSTADYYIFTVEITCEPSQDTIRQWQLEAFEAIMEAYDRKLSEYQRAIAQAQDADTEIRGSNPRYNRVVEQTELKKWCIQMMRHHSSNMLPWSEAMNHPSQPTTPSEVESRMPWFYNDWAAGHRPIIQLLEGAIDWELMVYEFLPYYWTARRQWVKLSQLQDAADPLFQNFLQAGMARVFVPIKRGMEASVAWYLSAQQVQPIGSDVYPDEYSWIKTEMKNADKDVAVAAEGAKWETVVPTALIVMQAASGAVAGTGLPCDCKKEDADGLNIATLQQNKITTIPCKCCDCCKETNTSDGNPISVQPEVIEK